MDEVVNFFAECASSFDASLVVESTKALLSLVKVRSQTECITFSSNFIFMNYFVVAD